MNTYKMNSILCIIIVAMILNEAVGTDHHMICKDVASVFEEDRTPQRNQRRLQGPPGKQGPPGAMGPKGDQGSNGTVDYAIVNATLEMLVNQRVEKEMIKIRSFMFDLNSSISNNQKQNGKPTAGKCNQRGGEMFADQCYWLILPENRVNFAEGNQLCEEQNGQPSDVISQQHYDMIADISRAKIPSGRSNINFWTGLTIDPSTMIVSLAEGSRPTTFTKWYNHRSPSSDSGYTAILIQFEKDPSSYHGMYNRSPTVTPYGILCQSQV